MSNAISRASGSTARFGWPVTAEQAHAALDDFIAHRLPELAAGRTRCGAASPSVAFAAIHRAEPRCRPAHGNRRHRRRLRIRPRAPRCRRRASSGRFWLARIRARRLWAADAGAGRSQPVRPQHAIARLVLDRRTHAACLAAAIGQTLEHGYAHHIQRLMITGNFCPARRPAPAPGRRLVSRRHVDAVALGRGNRTPWAWPQRLAGHDQQALLRQRRLYRPHERLLPQLPLQPENPRRPRLLPVPRCTGTSRRHRDRFAANPRMAMPLKTSTAWATLNWLPSVPGNKPATTGCVRDWQRQAPRRKVSPRKAKQGVFLPFAPGSLGGISGMPTDQPRESPPRQGAKLFRQERQRQTRFLPLRSLRALASLRWG